MIEFIVNAAINIMSIAGIVIFYHKDTREKNFLIRLSWLAIPVSCVVCIFYPNFIVYSIRDFLIASFVLYFITYKNYIEHYKN